MHLTRKEAAAAEAFRLSSRGPSAAQQRKKTEDLRFQVGKLANLDPERLRELIDNAAKNNPSLQLAAREMIAGYQL